MVLSVIPTPNDAPKDAWCSDVSSELGTPKAARGAKSGLFEFANTEAIKEKVRQTKLRPGPYNVHECYHEEGICQAIAKHPLFENVTLGVIVVNAFWIAVDTDGNKAETMLDAKIQYIVMDIVFLFYFTLELLVRFLSFSKKSDCCRDGWFLFDTTLVALYWFDPFLIAFIAALSEDGGGVNLPTSILRLFRLARLTRLVRMLRSLPELMIMIKGMVSAGASVGYTLGLLLVCTYVFAIALTQLSDGTEFREVYFFDVIESMYSLIIYGTFLDALSDFCNDIRAESPACMVLVFAYICLGSMTIMNMLVGVLCEVISAVAEEEQESMIVDKVNEKFGEVVARIDTDGNRLVSWKEFQKIMEFPDAIKALESVNVDPVGMVELAEDFFFEDDRPVQLNFSQFMEMVLDMRGGQQATLKDVMRSNKQSNAKFKDVKCRIEHVARKVSAVDNRMAGMDAKLDEIVSAVRNLS